MNNKSITKHAIINSVLAFAYIFIVAQVLRNAERFFGQMKEVLGPVAFILTFVFSAAIMGILIFGRPVLWYLDGLKKEAVRLVFYTLGFLFVILALVFLSLIL